MKANRVSWKGNPGATGGQPLNTKAARLETKKIFLKIPNEKNIFENSKSFHINNESEQDLEILWKGQPEGNRRATHSG